MRAESPAIGTRVRFTRDIWEGADDHSPAGTWASKGTEATITGSGNDAFACYVTPAGRPFGFGIYANEFEVIHRDALNPDESESR